MIILQAVAGAALGKAGAAIAAALAAFVAGYGIAKIGQQPLRLSPVSRKQPVTSVPPPSS